MDFRPNYTLVKLCKPILEKLNYYTIKVQLMLYKPIKEKLT